ncbi:MAG: M48 family metallopeptidase [Bacteroidota bacterium]
MKYSKIFLYGLLALMLTTCATVPITGRKQLNLIPSSTLLPMSFNQYSEFLNTNQLSTNSAETQMVKRVGNRIQRAVEKYMTQNGMASRLEGFQWEYNLVEDQAVNAWAMPGGKVVFYTGILPVTKNEDGLAVVMGHEIAHIIAGHGNERMSKGLLAQAGQVALSTYMRDQPQATQNMMLAAYGAGTQVGVMLPFSRKHEREADKLGLIFMAMAGYDLNEAPQFWERMSAMSNGQAPPEFLSTHPSTESRIQDMRRYIPEAMKYYQPNN